MNLDSTSNLIGNVINLSVLGLLIFSLLLTILLPAVRRQILKIWPVLAISLVLQIVTLVVLNFHTSVSEGSGTVSCLAEPVYDLGPDAPSIEMSTPLCRSASITHTIIAGVCLVLALTIWILMARRAFRITTPSRRIKTRHIVILVVVIALVCLGLVLALGLF